MSGAFSFGDKLISVMNTAATLSMVDFLRPYLARVNLSEKVLYHYDLYDGFIDFSELTPEQYMLCYRQLKKAFECDLRNSPTINGKSAQWHLNFWHDEIKPKMKCSPLWQEQGKK